MNIGDVGLGIGVIALFVVLVVFGPFVLIFGANFILEAMEYKEIPYTLGTWFGSLLIGGTLRVCK
jgi:hypothetical protein